MAPRSVKPVGRGLGIFYDLFMQTINFAWAVYTTTY